MNKSNSVLLLGMAILAVVFIAGINMNMQIRRLLKTLYPDLSKEIGDGHVLNNSINTSLALMKIIINPPKEINHPPLLRLFWIWRVLFCLQIITVSAFIVFGILNSSK